MTYFKWTEDMAVGITQVDILQRELTDSANRLFDALADGLPVKERLSNLLLKLDCACSIAEEAEEELQRRFSGAEAAARPAYHRDFERRIGRMLDRHQNGEDVALETLQLLADWLAYHQALGLGAWRDMIRPVEAGAAASALHSGLRLPN